MNDLGTFITNNSATITAKGSTPATLTANLNSISSDLSAKKGLRDLKKTDLGVAQAAYATSATNNYTSFSDLIDNLAGIVGKKTPAGQQVLGYRKHLNATAKKKALPGPIPK